MLLDRPDEDARPRHLDPPEPVSEAFGLLGRDPARPTIDADPGLVDRAEVAARRDVSGLERKVHPERLEHTSPDPVRQGIVPEERQMTGTASRSDPGPHRLVETDNRLPRQLVQVRRQRRLELRPPTRLQREPSEAVQHQKQDQAVRWPGQVGVVLKARRRGMPHRSSSTASSVSSSPSRSTTTVTASPGLWARRASVKA